MGADTELTGHLRNLRIKNYIREARKDGTGLAPRESAFAHLIPIVSFSYLPNYVRGGNTPCKAIQKFSVRYGIRLLCGRSPPAGGIAFGFIAPVAGDE